MESASQWVSKWEDFFFADEYVRHYVDAHTAKQSLPQVTAFKLVWEVLPDLELRVIEFLSEWMVSLLMPAKHLIESRSAPLVLYAG